MITIKIPAPTVLHKSRGWTYDHEFLHAVTNELKDLLPDANLVEEDIEYVIAAMDRVAKRLNNE